MSFAKHTTKPPDFDARAANDVFDKKLRKDDGSPFACFSGGFHRLNRWFLGIGEYDGHGLKDVVEANADGLDALKGQADAVKGRVGDLEDRVAALEAQPVAPFPVSS